MEKQSESVAWKNQDTSSMLFALHETLRNKQQQLDNLRRENEALTKDLNEFKESQEGQRINFSLLETALQQIKLKMQQKDSKILDMIHENGTLQGKLEIQSKQFLVTLEQNDEIVELKQKLVDLHYKDVISNSSRNCKHCSFTQRELEVMRREYNQMREANEKLNKELSSCAQDNCYLKYKMKTLQTESEKTTELHRNEIQSEIKKAMESLYVQQMTTHSTNLNKRQIEGRRVSPQCKRARLGNQEDDDLKDVADHPTERMNDATKPTSSEGNDRQLPEVNISCGPAASTPKPKPNRKAFSSSGTFTTVAEIHPEPADCDIPYQITDERTNNIANDVTVGENNEDDSATDHRHEMTDDVICLNDETVVPTKGEKTIIRERYEVIKKMKRNSSAGRNPYLDNDSTTQTNNESDDETKCSITVTPSRRPSIDDDDDDDPSTIFKSIHDYEAINNRSPLSSRLQRK